MEDIEEFAELFKKDVCFKMNHHGDNHLYHVLDVFDGWNVAVKYYGKHKQWWHYEFQNIYFLYEAYKFGRLEIKGKK